MKAMMDTDFSHYCEGDRRTVRKVADAFRRQLSASVDGECSPYMWNCIKEMIKQFERQLRSVPDEKTDVESYSVLRQSLQESTRRHEATHADMMRHQEANEELVNTLTTLKDSNRRLMDEVRSLTEENVALTQCRVEDEVRIEKMQRTFSATEESWNKDSQRRFSAFHSTSEARIAQLKTYYEDKMRAFKMMLEMMKAELSGLRTCGVDQKFEISNWSETMRLTLTRCMTEVLHRTEKMTENFKSEVSQFKAQLDSAEKRLQSEKEMRQREVVAWTHRYSTLQGEKDSMESSSHAKITMYSAELSKLETQLQTDRETLALQHRKINYEEQEVERVQHDINTERRLRDQEKIENSEKITTYEEKLREHEIVLTELRTALHATQEALTRQRQDNDTLSRKSLAELDDTKAKFERTMEKRIHEKDIEYTRVECLLQQEKKEKEDSVTQYKTTLNKIREEYERTLERMSGDSRRKEDALMSEMLSVNNQIENAQIHSDQLKSECSRTRTEMVEATDSYNRIRLEKERLDRTQRDSQEELEDMVQRWKSLEEKSRRDEIKLNDTKSELTQALAEATTAKEEWARIHIKTQEEHTKVKANCDQQMQIKADEIQQLQLALETERNERINAKERYDAWYEKHTSDAALEAEENNRRHMILEATKAQKEDALREELAESRNTLLHTQTKLSDHKAEMARNRQVLSDVQANLMWIQTEKEREMRETDRMKKRHEDDVRSLRELLDMTRMEECRAARKTEALQSHHEVDRIAMRNEVEVARKDAIDGSRVEACRQLENCKKEYSTYLRFAENKFLAELDEEKSKVDNIIKENDQLKHSIREHRSATQGVTDLHSDIEVALRRLETQTKSFKEDMFNRRNAGWRANSAKSPNLAAGTPNPISPGVSPIQVPSATLF